MCNCISSSNCTNAVGSNLTAGLGLANPILVYLPLTIFYVNGVVGICLNALLAYRLYMRKDKLSYRKYSLIGSVTISHAVFACGIICITSVFAPRVIGALFVTPGIYVLVSGMPWQSLTLAIFTILLLKPIEDYAGLCILQAIAVTTPLFYQRTGDRLIRVCLTTSFVVTCILTGGSIPLYLKTRHHCEPRFRSICSGETYEYWLFMAFLLVCLVAGLALICCSYLSVRLALWRRTRAFSRYGRSNQALNPVKSFINSLAPNIVMFSITLCLEILDMSMSLYHYDKFVRSYHQLLPNITDPSFNVSCNDLEIKQGLAAQLDSGTELVLLLESLAWTRISGEPLFHLLLNPELRGRT